MVRELDADKGLESFMNKPEGEKRISNGDAGLFGGLSDITKDVEAVLEGLLSTPM
jgi:hypothetical protein